MAKKAVPHKRWDASDSSPVFRNGGEISGHIPRIWHHPGQDLFCRRSLIPDSSCLAGRQADRLRRVAEETCTAPEPSPFCTLWLLGRLAGSPHWKEGALRSPAEPCWHEHQPSPAPEQGPLASLRERRARSRSDRRRTVLFKKCTRHAPLGLTACGFMRGRANCTGSVTSNCIQMPQVKPTSKIRSTFEPFSNRAVNLQRSS